MDDIFDWKPGKWDWLKYFFPRKWIKIKDIYYEIKYAIQKIFIGYSDMQVIEMYSELAHHIWPIIKDYRKNHQGYPAVFSEYNEDEWGSKEKYDKAIADGSMLGGGSEAWLKIVDQIIFSFEFIITEDSSPRTRKEKKMVKEFKNKYGDVWEKKDNNKQKYNYHLFVNENEDIKDTDIASAHIPEENFDENTIAEEEAKGMTYKGFKKRNFYHNDELAKELNDKCEKGLELFGKWFRAFWL